MIDLILSLLIVLAIICWMCAYLLLCVSVIKHGKDNNKDGKSDNR